MSSHPNDEEKQMIAVLSFNRFSGKLPEHQGECANADERGTRKLPSK